MDKPIVTLQLAGALAEEGCSLEEIVETVTEALKGIGESLFHSIFSEKKLFFSSSLLCLNTFQARWGWVCPHAASQAACRLLTCHQEPWSLGWVRLKQGCYCANDSNLSVFIRYLLHLICGMKCIISDSPQSFSTSIYKTFKINTHYQINDKK